MTTNNGIYNSISEYYAEIIEMVKLRLELFRLRKEGEKEDGIVSDIEKLDNRILRRNQATLENRGYIPLEHVCGVFELTPFERHCVISSIVMEIDASFQNAYGELLAQPHGVPSIELAIKLFAKDFSDYIKVLSGFTGRKKVLSLLFDLSSSSAESSLLRPLKLKQRVIDFILNSTTDINDIPCKLFLPSETLDECLAEEELSSSIAYYVDNCQGKSIVILEGEKGSGKKYHIKRFSADYGMPIMFVDGDYLLKASPISDIIRSICTEAIIQQAALCLTDIPGKDSEDSMETEKNLKDIILKIMEYCQVLFITTTEASKKYIGIGDIKYIKYRTTPNNATQRKYAWNLMCKEYTVSQDVNFGLTANKYAVAFGLIRSASERAYEIAKLSHKSEIDESMINTACKEQITHSLGKRAVSVNAHYTWDELILPELQKETLRNACNQLKFRDVVYEKWNFKRKMAYGTGLSMLFSGPPGTGKTMAAQVIANDVDLDIYKVDLSSLVSKYIGETEKNLSIVFDEVKKSHSILFFDEADSIFGKRGEQKDSNDRFANIQTSYLLQRFEDYEGIVILATNFVQNFDDAFLRRIKFKVDFPFPDAEYRRKIWESLMISEAPFEDMDLDFLSEQFTLSGSSIKNVIINAAFLAASQNAAISMRQIISAIKIEYSKTNKIILKEELKEYAEFF